MRQFIAVLVLIMGSGLVHGANEIVARKDTTDLRFGDQLLSLKGGEPDDFGIVDVILETAREKITMAVSR